LVGRVPSTELLTDLVDLDEQGYVLADDRMATKTPGLFTAGDLNKKPLRQIITAAADGAIAATSVASYLGQPVEG
jgi:FAD-dependent pyridine nucleotide-disulphide oxidoreductase